MYPENLTQFIKNATSNQLSLFSKVLMNKVKFAKSIPTFQNQITEFESILWPSSDLTIGIKVQWIKQDIFSHPTCKVCGKELKWMPGLTRYNKDYCNAQCYGKDETRNRGKKEIDLPKAIHLYNNERKSFLEISEILGNASNVTVKKLLIEAGVEMRSHSETQHINRYIGPYKGPKIVYDKTILVKQYVEDKLPISVMADLYKCNEETVRRLLKQTGIQLNNNNSKPEFVIQSILDKHSIKYKINDRKTIYPKEIDFLLLDFPVGIEVHGLYYHSLVSGNKPKYYHQEKFTKASEVGIKLFQFWETDITNRVDVVESMILAACGMIPDKVYARDCEVKSITAVNANLFCDRHHLQGSSSNVGINYGLFNDDVLVSVMMATKKNDETVIVRFCSKKFLRVVGGFSKLLARLTGKIKTFSSNMYSDGKLYKNSGFDEISEKVDLNYTDYKSIFNRRKFQKNTLEKKLAIFNPELSEQENMIANGYDILWGAGIKTWVKE